MKGVLDDKTAELIPAGWFEACGRHRTAIRRARSKHRRSCAVPNGVVQDIGEFWAAGKAQYDPADIRVPPPSRRTSGMQTRRARRCTPTSPGRPCGLAVRRYVEIGEGNHPRRRLEKNRMAVPRGAAGFRRESESMTTGNSSACDRRPSHCLPWTRHRWSVCISTAKWAEIDAPPDMPCSGCALDLRTHRHQIRLRHRAAWPARCTSTARWCAPVYWPGSTGASAPSTIEEGAGDRRQGGVTWLDLAIHRGYCQSGRSCPQPPCSIRLAIPAMPTSDAAMAGNIC